MRCKGITLAELLVVIGIIILLAALLFPVLLSARFEARKNACINNLKQLWTAIELYRQDWNGIDPIEGVPIPIHKLGLPDGDDETIPPNCGAIPLRYIRNCEVWWCPNRYADPRFETDLRTTPSLISSYNFIYEDDLFPLALAKNPEFPILDCTYHNRIEVGYVRGQARPYMTLERLLGLSLNGTVRFWKYNEIICGSQGELCH